MAPADQCPIHNIPNVVEYVYVFHPGFQSSRQLLLKLAALHTISGEIFGVLYQFIIGSGRVLFQNREVFLATDSAGH